MSEANRKHVEVAVGILQRADGALLFTRRPPGKPYAGYWEFPGGKIESGETVEHALRRELMEELGITIGPVTPWKVTEYDYPHALVRLHWCKVFEWQGVLEMREGQTMCWQPWPVSTWPAAALQPMLPGAWPVLQWLVEERISVSPALPADDPVHPR